MSIPRTLLIVDGGLFMSWAHRMTREYDRVLYFRPWTKSFSHPNDFWIGQGYDFERVEHFWHHVDEADTIAFFDIHFPDWATHLRDMGKPVWSAFYGENLELDRIMAKQVMEQVGLPVNDYEVVNGMDELREFLQENDDQYVKIPKLRGLTETFHSVNYDLVKVKLDDIEHKLGGAAAVQQFICESNIDAITEVGYDGWCINGEFAKTSVFSCEIKDCGSASMVKPYNLLPREVREVNSKLSPVLGEYGYQGFWSSEIRVTKKSFFATDFTCFSDDTEVLTNEGWKRFGCCLGHEELATLNVDTRDIEFQSPSKWHRYNYSGNMVLLTNPKKTIECLVTPDHDVLRYSQRKHRLFKQKASDLIGQGFVPRTGKWSVTSRTTFELPEYRHQWVSNCGRNKASCVKREKRECALQIEIQSWAAFMAWYLSEGSLSRKYIVSITQTNHVEELHEVLSVLPFRFTRNRHGFQCNSVQLATYLKQFGKCSEKHIPDYIRFANEEVIQVFLDNYLLADGYKRGHRRFYVTTSRQMADNLQELILKIGRVSNIQCRKHAGTEMTINGKSYIRNHDIFVLEELRHSSDFWFNTCPSNKTQFVKSVPYNGDVFCATVPNGTLYVRRNGKPFWSGNCRAASPCGENLQELFSNMGEVIEAGAHGEIVEPKPVARYAVQAVIESVFAEEHWLPIEIAPEIRPYVKLYNSCVIEGQEYIVPTAVDLPQVGSIVCTGDTLDSAIKKVEEYAKEIKAYQLDVDLKALEKAKVELGKAA